MTVAYKVCGQALTNANNRGLGWGQPNADIADKWVWRSLQYADNCWQRGRGGNPIADNHCQIWLPFSWPCMCILLGSNCCLVVTFRYIKMWLLFPDRICADQSVRNVRAPCPASPVHCLWWCPGFGWAGCIINFMFINSRISDFVKRDDVNTILNT